MEINVYNIKGEDIGREVTLNESIFGIELNDHTIYLDVEQFMANQRQGTHRSKERSETSDSTCKIGRQKGDSGAYRGDVSSPALIDGARVFGSKPRDYFFRLNRKVKILARKSALPYKVQNSALIVVEDFVFETPKTKDLIATTKNLRISDEKLLVASPEVSKNIYLLAHSIEDTNVQTILELGTCRVLNAEAIVLTESPLKTTNNILI